MQFRVLYHNSVRPADANYGQAELSRASMEIPDDAKSPCSVFLLLEVSRSPCTCHLQSPFVLVSSGVTRHSTNTRRKGRHLLVGDCTHSALRSAGGGGIMVELHHAPKVRHESPVSRMAILKQATSVHSDKRSPISQGNSRCELEYCKRNTDAVFANGWD